MQDASAFENPSTSCSFLPARKSGPKTHPLPGPPGSLALAAPWSNLLRVQFDEELPVQHKLPRLRTRGRQTRSPHHVIQAAFEHDDEVLAGWAFGARGLLKIIAELPLQQPVSALDLLLLAQLQAVSGDLRAP